MGASRRAPAGRRFLRLRLALGVVLGALALADLGGALPAAASFASPRARVVGRASRPDTMPGYRAVLDRAVGLRRSWGGRDDIEARIAVRAVIAGCRRAGVNDRSHLAYAFATAEVESVWGVAMHEIDPPPSHGRYYGRGFVQLTFEGSYARFTEVLRADGFDVDLLADPDLAATDPKVAAWVLCRGMSQGLFTGRRLSDFGQDGRFDFVGARRIVNGTDRAEEIAAIARTYRSWL